MGRTRVKQLKNIAREANKIMDRMDNENNDLKNRVAELEENCEHFAAVEQNLHKRIRELEKPGLKQRVKSFLGVTIKS